MKWEIAKLGDISKNIQTGPFGSQLHQSDYSECGIPVVMPKDLVGGKISEESIARVDKTHVERLCRHKIEVGDILYSRRGDVGRCAHVTKKEEGWLCGTECLRVTIDSEKADSRFVFFQLQHPDTVGWVEKHAVGATMLNLNTTILSSVPIRLPALEIQKRIADILSAYDDLIENNQKQIKLLEEAAQRLYKEWFVDLRFPGHENTKIVDGVPEGWRISSIYDVFDIKYGKNLPTSKITKAGQYPVYGASGVIGYYNEKNCDDYATLVTSRGNGSGDVFRTHHKQSYVTNNSFIARRNDKNSFIENEFTFQLFSNTDFKKLCTGSAQPQLTNTSIQKIKILLPNRQLIEKYQRCTIEMSEKQEALYQEQRALTQARNRLLPKLMNGTVEV